MLECYAALDYSNSFFSVSNSTKLWTSTIWPLHTD